GYGRTPPGGKVMAGYGWVRGASVMTQLSNLAGPAQGRYRAGRPEGRAGSDGRSASPEPGPPLLLARPRSPQLRSWPTHRSSWRAVLRRAGRPSTKSVAYRRGGGWRAGGT